MTPANEYSEFNDEERTNALMQILITAVISDESPDLEEVKKILSAGISHSHVAGPFYLSSHKSRAKTNQVHHCSVLAFANLYGVHSCAELILEDYLTKHRDNFTDRYVYEHISNAIPFMLPGSIKFLERCIESGLWPRTDDGKDLKDRERLLQNCVKCFNPEITELLLGHTHIHDEKAPRFFQDLREDLEHERQKCLKYSHDFYVERDIEAESQRVDALLDDAARKLLRLHTGAWMTGTGEPCQAIKLQTRPSVKSRP